MTSKSTLGSLLLLSSALVAPSALAQTIAQAPPMESGPSQNSPSAETVSDDQPAAEDQPEEQVEVSIPGGESIVVTGQRDRNVIRNSPQVVSVLSSEDIARTGEGDIAGSLQRVTGLSIVGNGFVFVRGLGDRYSLSLLNGSPLPSPEPLRRVVPLDIFPTSIIASALVQKSYSPNFPGEFGGGVINLTTTATPAESFFEITGSLGGDTFTTDNLGYAYYGGDTDYLGFDDGTRAVPACILAAGQNGTRIAPQDLISLNNASTTLLQTNRRIPPNWSTGFSAGTTLEIAPDARLGIIANGGISNSWATRDALQQTGDVTGEVATQFRTVLTDNRVVVNGLLGLGLELGPHRLRLTNLYIHDTVKQGRLSSGFDLNAGAPPTAGQPDPVIRQGTYFFERELYDLQGVAEFDFGDLDVDLRGTYARTQRLSPYERDFSYAYNSQVRDYINRLSGSFESATISFSDLDEDVWAGGIDVSYRNPLGLPLTVTAGYAYNDTSRFSTRYFFRYRGANGSPLALQFGQLRPDFLLSDVNIQLNGITLNPEAATGAAAYQAGLKIHAGYVMADVELAEGLSLSTGVRYEDADQFVSTQGGFVPTNLSNSYFLPSATLTWTMVEGVQLRVHGSKTIARPQFRELAPQQYQDFESDREFFGNPLLVDSELYNAEARIEYYFGRDQRLSLSGFFKRINNPIEAVASPPVTSADILVGFTNAPKANLYGAEIEVQRYVPLEGLGIPFFATRRLLLAANYTYSQSALIVGDEQVFAPIQPSSPDPANPIRNTLPASNIFQDGAPLIGQSEHLANIQVGIDDTERLSQLTFLFNYASQRVTNRGSRSPVYPDFVEDPGLRVDVVFRQAISLGFALAELNLEARNIFGTGHDEFQDYGNGIVTQVNSYAQGSRFSAGLSVRF
jgi:outer membrane receptor protein involved in Fe transport